MTRIGVAFSGSGLTPGETVECVRLAEELDYESAWMTEGHTGDQFAIFPRYNRLFADAVATVKAAWDRGDRGGGPAPKARVVAAIRACAP